MLMAVVVTMSMALTGCEDSSGDDNDGGGDAALIVGSWKVVSDWRWSQMTFRADGTKSQVDRVSGATLNRGTWSVQDGKLILVSDVTEVCPYTVTKKTLRFTLPSGNQQVLARIP